MFGLDTACKGTQHSAVGSETCIPRGKVGQDQMVGSASIHKEVRVLSKSYI